METQSYLGAMRDDLGELLEILSWARPHRSAEERLFIKEHVTDWLTARAVEFEVDGFGNVWAYVPAANGGLPMPHVLWSCHVDTVHARGGRQQVIWKDATTIGLKKRKPGRCLGADDGAGIWLLREMIKAGQPGTYVFHRGEEVGRLGSEYVATNEAERLKDFDACVAFDRRGTDNFITHQSGWRGVSAAFADSFIDALGDASERRLKYVHDDTGSYTDSYSYFDHIPECANVSCGYEREHGPNETLDGHHIWQLRNALIKADFSDLKIERDPSEQDYDWGDHYGYGAGWSGSRGYPSGGQSFTFGHKPSYREGTQGGGWLADEDRSGAPAFGTAESKLVGLVKQFPETAAELLSAFGIDAAGFCDELGVSLLDAGAHRSIMGAA